jgi:predicted RNase H-like HicB family nuclease
MLIQWSDEDDAFLVTLPEWKDRVLNPVTHGATYEEAVQRGQEVLELLVELSLDQGEPLPQPKSASVAA